MHESGAYFAAFHVHCIDVVDSSLMSNMRGDAETVLQVSR